MPRKSKGSGTSMIKDLAFKHKVFLESLGIDYNNYLFVSSGKGRSFSQANRPLL